MKILKTKEEFINCKPGHYILEGEAAKEFARQAANTLKKRAKKKKENKK